MNGAEKIVNAMKKVSNSSKLPSSQIISATITSVNPLKFQLENRLEIDENFYELSNLEDWRNVKVGDKVRAFSYNDGQKYYISELLQDKNYNMFGMNRDIEKILSGDADIKFNPIGTGLSATTVSEAIKELANGSGSGTGEGTYNYNNLENKPKIEGVELVGNKTALELGLLEIGALNEYVSVTSQTFTDEQQNKARENIGANQLYGEIDPTVLTKAKYIGQLYVNTTSRKIFYCYDIKDGQYYWNHFSQTFVKEINIPPENKTITIQHDMNCYPNVKILDTNGDTCYADILFNDENTITLTFDIDMFNGKVLLNY